MHRRSAGQVRNNYATGLSRRGIRLAFWNEWTLPSGGNVSHTIAIICFAGPIWHGETELRLASNQVCAFS